jgi:hypothetical protein
MVFASSLRARSAAGLDRIVDARQRGERATASCALRKVPLALLALLAGERAVTIGREFRRIGAMRIAGDTAYGEPLADNPLEPIALLAACQLSPPWLTRS